MEIFLVSKRALPWFLNEENLEQSEQKTRLNRDSCREKKTNERKRLNEISHACCVRVYIYKYRFNFFSTRFSLSFFPSLSLSLSCE